MIISTSVNSEVFVCFVMIKYMEEYDKDLYFVAVKVFLRDNNKLLIIHDIFGDWDLPGGRIKKDEFSISLDSVIHRKIKEELGDEIHYSKPIQNGVFFRVERLEHDLNRNVRIFAVGYEAEYKKGKITLGKHMDDFKWVDISNFDPKEYFKGGWLNGVEDYLVTV
jgi:8-oxo-dGTP pyrophosphatase MutT (NUDIX family)